MRTRTLPRHALNGAGWTHPYPTGPFSPCLYADGGDGGDSDTSGGGTDGDDGDAGDDAVTGGAGGDGDKASGKPAAKKDDGDGHTATVKRLEKELADARREAGKSRTEAKKQAADEAVKALTEKLGKALGFVKEDGPPDPEKLAKAVAEKDTAIAERDTTIRGLSVQIAVLGRAEKGKFRAAALLDRTSFTRAIADLDPTHKDFGSQLDAAIKSAVEADPTLRVTPPAGKSGGDHTGSSGEGAKKERSGSLAGAIRSHYGT